MKDELLEYVLRLGDNELILGHRLSEWCGHGPELEEDIALINIALDHIGQCRSYYQYAAEITNDGRDEDSFAYLRNERDFKNLLLLEMPNGHYGDTIMRSFLYDTFMVLYYNELKNSKDSRLSAIAEKSLKEVKYHYRHSAEWVIRLGDGTEESHSRIQESLDNLWGYTNEMFEMTDVDAKLIEAGFAVDKAPLKDKWTSQVKAVFDEATLELPSLEFFQSGGLKGVHTEHLGYILAEMQYLKRQIPEATW